MARVRAALIVLLAPLFAAAQNCDPALPGGELIVSPGYWVGYRTHPAPIPVGRHFSIELAVCPKSGVRTIESVRVDAWMPAHRHGMNYQPEVVSLGDGRFRAEGLMFHMPGRWELIFDVRSGDTNDRVTHTLLLE